jgi:peptidoglycan/LPS O-acetylase OafA/YrhL
MNTTSTSPSRRYYLDWLRVIAILAIFVFHCTRLFDTDDWSIKNMTTYPFMDIWNKFAISWGMPLILLISGSSAFLSLDKFKPGKYVKGLFLRLFVPLIFGMFTHVAFQVYLEFLQKRKFSGSFFAFYPHYFEGMYGFGGSFAWMGLHLWYLELLFILSLLCLPLFLWFKKTHLGQRTLQGLGNLLAFPGAIYLLALPAIYLITHLDPETWGNQDLGGWSVLIYPFFYIGGFLLLSSERLQARTVQMRWVYLGLGIILSPIHLFFEFQARYPNLESLGDKLADPLICLVVWSWLLSVFGFGKAYLSFNTPFLKYANEATLPFYIIHQTVIVCLAYFIVQWAIPDLLKFMITLCGSFLVTVSLYEFLVRRYNILRFLFGMKPLRKSPLAQPQLELVHP